MASAKFWEPAIDRGQYGRITAPERYSGQKRQLLEYCRRVIRITKKELERHYGWTLNRLDFFFLDGKQPNAAMFQHRKRHAVGVCVGLPFTVKSNLDRALENPEFLPEYLTPHERPEWSIRFLGMIIEHVYLHEAAHALRGHLAYVGRAIAHRTVDERRRSLNSDLELDADLQAVDMWLAITEAADDFPKRQNLLLDLYFQRVFTILLLYQTLDAGNRAIREHLRFDHPAPVHRALMLSAAMRQTIPDRHHLPVKLVDDTHHQAFWEASVAARTSKLLEDRWWGGKSGRRRGMKVYSRMIRHYLSVVEPTLDTFVAGLPDDLV
jgi:hypothetical protein